MSTLTISPQYLTDGKGQRISVVLKMSDYEQILEMLEELEDLRLCDAAKKLGGEKVSLSDYMAKRKLRADA